MPKQLKYELNDRELEAVEKAIRYDKESRVVKRATAVRLLHLGHRPQEVARMLNVTMSSVYNWHQRWREDGIEGLRDKPKSGRPPKADDAYCQALEQALNSNPAEHGYTFAIWTVERLCEHLMRGTGVALSEDRLRVVMQKLGYVYRRPTTSLEHTQDREAHDQADALIDELKKEPNKALSSFSLWTKRP